MNNLRIREKNIIHIEIKKLHGFIVHAERNISASLDETIIEKLKTGINEKNERISLLEKRLKDVDNGKLDDELEKSMSVNLDEINRKHTNTQSQKSKIAEQTKLREVKAKESAEGISSAQRNEKFAEKNYKYTLKYFDKTCDLIPDYLLKELSEKPNNRGFVWRGVQLYGQKPPVDDPTEFELIERVSKEQINIHIWNKFVYEIYSKKHGELPVKIYYLERNDRFKIPDGITFKHR